MRDNKTFIKTFISGCDSDRFNSTIHGEFYGWTDGDCMFTPWYQLGWTIFGVIIILLWTLSLSSLIFGVLWYFDILRIDPDTEVRGIDIPAHGEPAYPVAAYGHGWDYEGNISLDGILTPKLAVSDIAYAGGVSQ